MYFPFHHGSNLQFGVGFLGTLSTQNIYYQQTH
jgi:hypothetical protein